jgi:glycosyltransferase involved in cell wall biosynthesis
LDPNKHKVVLFDDNNFEKELCKDDVDIYYSCSPSQQGQLDLIKILKKFDRKVIVDYDDTEEVNPTNHMYCLYGTEECEVELSNGAKFKWEDNKTEVMLFGQNILFDINRNKKNKEITKQIKREASCIVTTTETLKKELLKYNDKVYVIPNMIDVNIYNKPAKDKDIDYNHKDVRVGWVLSSSHLDDFVSLKPELLRCLKSNDNMKLVIMCFGLYAEVEEMQEKYPDRIEIVPGVNINNGYHKIFSRLNLDIGICHVEDNYFNKCKSSIKYAEYSAMGIPTVASNCLYGEFGKDEKNIYLYNDMKEFRGIIKYLCNRPIYRERVGKQAKIDCEEIYGKEKIIKLYDNMIGEITNEN